MEHERLPRKLAAVLYADVVGYSRLMGEAEDATHRTLADYLDLFSATVTRHQGRVVHYAGDAVLARFDAALDALTCAIEIQRALAARNAEGTTPRKVEFRIGVNLGDVIEDRGDIYGDGVNTAARLQELAEPGHICVSQAGRMDEARAVLAEVESEAPTSWTAYGLATLHSQLGNRDAAFEWLAYEPPHAWVPWARIDPWMRPGIEDDPRFEAFLERLRLPR